MNVVGYTRVSTEEQARDGVSLDAQAEKQHRSREELDEGNGEADGPE